MKKHIDSMDAVLVDRMRSAQPGRVFSPRDFLDLGSRAAVDQALSRNARAGNVRRVARGLYDVPRTHPSLGQLSPDTDAVARTVAARDEARLLPSGAHAANMLGLSDQVPVKPVYLTDGPSRRIRMGKQTVVLKHRQRRSMATTNRTSALLIHGLRWIGRVNVDDRTIATLRRNLSAGDRAGLLADVAHAPAWIADVFRRVAQDSAK
jgi:hypothetical protein